MSNSETKIILNSQIVAASKQLMDGLISVTQFCYFCTQFGWTISEIHTDRQEIVFCFDTGETDAFDIPIIQFTALTVD